MDQLVATIPWTGWAIFAGMAGLSIVAELVPHLRHSWRGWRQEHRNGAESLLPVMPGAPPDDGLEPVEWGPLLFRGGRHGLIVAAPFVLAEAWGETGVLLFGLVGALYSVWRWLSDAELRESAEQCAITERIVIPKEAAYGMLSASMIIALLLLTLL